MFNNWKIYLYIFFTNNKNKKFWFANLEKRDVNQRKKKQIEKTAEIILTN